MASERQNQNDRIERDAWRLIFAAYTGRKITFVAPTEAHAKAVFKRAKERLTEAQG